MRRLTGYLLATFLVLAVAACTDAQARADIAQMKADLQPWLNDVQAFQQKVSNAVCQLEVDVYDKPDSGSDTRTAGPPASPGSNRLCPSGPGDPNGLPPTPPQL